MNESVLVVQWKGDVHSLVHAVDRFTKDNDLAHHVHVLGFKSRDETQLHFWNIRKGPRVWLIAAETQESAIKQWKLELGWIGQFFYKLQLGNTFVITEDTESVTLTEAGYKQKLTMCDSVQYV
jgi:hypothetical protein